MRSVEEIMDLCSRVRSEAYALHVYLKHGHIEKVYENGLAHRLQKVGIKVEAQWPLQVCDEDGAVLGEMVADLFIEDCIIAEVKAADAIAPAHVAQLLGYLRASRIEHGLLVNFGAPRFQIKKYILSRPSLLPAEPAE